MLRRAIAFAARSYLGGPARSWIFTSGAMLAFRLVKRVVGRKELIDLSSVKPGETILIEHLPVSHKQQIKELRRDKKTAKRQAKATKKEAKAAKAGRN